MTKQLMTRRETAARLRMSLAWLDQGRVLGWGPPFIKIGHAVRYDPDVVDEYLVKQTYRTTSQQTAA